MEMIKMCGLNKFNVYLAFFLVSYIVKCSLELPLNVNNLLKNELKEEAPTYLIYWLHIYKAI